MSSIKAMQMRKQRGGIMVEAAITLLVFITLLLAIMELSIFVYRLSSLADATREGARHLSVSTPIDPDVKVYRKDMSEATCSELVQHSCSEGGCDSLLVVMRNRLETIQPENVFYRYTCADTGFNENELERSYFQIYSVDVWVEGIEYGFLTPGLSLIQLEMPNFKATRLSEDLDTVVD